MNKLGVVFGVTAVVALAGCVDPYYRKPADRMQNHVKEVQPETEAETPTEVTPVETTEVVVKESTCTCEPGTKHTEPCGCGAEDCACVVTTETKPTATAEETTDYIVQRGDYLAKISKKYNVTIAAIRRVNPQLKGDVIKIGQKIKLPGKIDVGEQKVPEGAFATKTKPATKEYKAYTGATKEYVVKSGDTLGAIAYGNGINIRQLKELNGLSSNMIRVGDKLKIPAEKVAEKKTAVTERKPVAEKKAPVKAPEQPVVEDVVAPEMTPAETPVAPADANVTPVDQATDTPAPIAEDFLMYEVQEGEDIMGISLRFSVDPAEIRELNNLGEADELKSGQMLKLPAHSQD